MECYAQSGDIHHRQIIGAITNGEGVFAWNMVFFSEFLQGIRFVLCIDYATFYIAGEHAINNFKLIRSNQFEIIDGMLTGNVKGSVVDAQYKANTLQKLAEEYHIPRKNTLAIGDGANDLAMMNVAGLGVAFHAKPKVQQQAQIVVNFADLTALLCLLSANDRI